MEEGPRERQPVFIIGNLIGMIMIAIAFAVAYGVGEMSGTSTVTPLMIIAGLLLAAMDVAYRLIAKDGHLYIPNRGGSIFFLPAWVYGVLFLVFGIVNNIQAKS